MDKKIYKFKAYWVVNGQEIRVFPKSKRINMFETIEQASSRLEKISKFHPVNTRGIVKDWNNNEVLTIAL